MEEQQPLSLRRYSFQAAHPRSTDISAAYVSPVLYQNLSCEQIPLEAQSVSAPAALAAGAQDQKATRCDGER